MRLAFLVFISMLAVPAVALYPSVQAALDQLIAEKSASAPKAQHSQKDLLRDVDEFENRLLPAVVTLTRITPFIQKRMEDLTSLETYLQTVRTSTSGPYSDKAWVDQARTEAMAVCCAIRNTPSLMREVQDNLVNGNPPLSDASLLAIENAAKAARQNKTVPTEVGSDEIQTRPFPIRQKPKPAESLVKKRSWRDGDEGEPEPEVKRRGIISGLPDLQEPPPEPPPELPPALPPPPAPAPVPPPVSP